ncbi:MAG: hypothetical protein ACREXP_31090, partial [Steroidobacteraceae bacterium]
LSTLLSMDESSMAADLPELSAGAADETVGATASAAAINMAGTILRWLHCMSSLDLRCPCA